MLDGVKNSGGEPMDDVFPPFGVSAFGAYDVRGVIGENLTAELYYRAARAAAPPAPHVSLLHQQSNSSEGA